MAKADDEGGKEQNAFQSLLAIFGLSGLSLIAIMALILLLCCVPCFWLRSFFPNLPFN